MADATLYYRHSGKFSPAAVLLTLTVGIIAAIVLGALYGIIVYYMPIVYVNVLLTFGVGIAVGATVRKVAMAQQIRNVPLVLLLALICGLVAEYAAFIGWVAAVTSWNVILFNPQKLWIVLDAIAEQGVWSLKKSTVKGPFLVGIWIVEAIVVVGGSIYMVWVEVANTPFCEKCAGWLTEKSLVGPFRTIANTDQLKADLEEGNFAALGDISPLKKDDPISRFAEYELTDCPTCAEMAVVTIRNVTLTADKEGKVTRKETNIIKRLLIDKASCDLIKELGPKPGEATEEDADATTPANDNVAALEAANQEPGNPS